jgi:hypothetical protein
VHIQLTNLRKTIAFLELHSLENFSWSINASHSVGHAEITISYKHLGGTREARKEMDRKLKSLFNHRDFESNWDNSSKNRNGSRKLGDDFTLECTVLAAFVCRPRTKEELMEMTDTEKDEFFTQAIEGLATVTICEDPEDTFDH